MIFTLARISSLILWYFLLPAAVSSWLLKCGKIIYHYEQMNFKNIRHNLTIQNKLLIQTNNDKVIFKGDFFLFDT